jgi:hypothetical protein
MSEDQDDADSEPSDVAVDDLKTVGAFAIAGVSGIGGGVLLEQLLPIGVGALCVIAALDALRRLPDD